MRILGRGGRPQNWRLLLAALVALLSASACSSTGARPDPPRRHVPATPSGTASPTAPEPGRRPVTSWAYQLQGYAEDGLGALARAPQQLLVLDLARDASREYFSSDEIARLHARGKTVLAYLEIGSIESFRPEYGAVRRLWPDLVLNRWEDWPEEYFVRYWQPRWWDHVIRPRLDQALRAGFDGVYLDTPLAYEELDLRLVPGETRDRLARRMVALIVRISTYVKARRPTTWVVPQNSPELRHYRGYTAAIDGIGMEGLFFEAMDRACTEDYCAENLAEARALRSEGKMVLAVDYARRPGHVATACARYRAEGFVGYVTSVALDRISPSCP